MKIRIITTVAFAACLALCAAVWPQAKPVEETPAAPTPTAVTATKPEVSEIPKNEEVTIPEEEKADLTELERAEEVGIAPEPTPSHMHPEGEISAASEQDPESTVTSPDRASDNVVYVPGFGWLESQGPNHCEYAEDMYENGNKIGIMG